MGVLVTQGQRAAEAVTLSNRLERAVGAAVCGPQNGTALARQADAC